MPDDPANAMNRRGHREVDDDAGEGVDADRGGRRGRVETALLEETTDQRRVRRPGSRRRRTSVATCTPVFGTSGTRSESEPLNATTAPR